MKTQKGMSLAALFFLEAKMYRVGPKPVLEMAKNPESQLFLRLEAMAPRERISIHPGRLLVAVYNDNWRAYLLLMSPYLHELPCIC